MSYPSLSRHNAPGLQQERFLQRLWLPASMTHELYVKSLTVGYVGSV